MTIRIIVADDHNVIRQGICALLEKDPEIEVVAEASDGQAAADLAAKHTPHIVLMDLAMPKMNGIEAMRKISEKNPQIKVIILSMHSDKTFVTRALKAGARGYMVKDCAAVELLQAIRAVVAGRTYLSPAVTGGIVEEYVKQAAATETNADPELTPREREILQLIVEGKQTREMAAIYNVSTKTIETHRHRIMTKLNIDSVAGLTKYALIEGIISLDK